MSNKNKYLEELCDAVAKSIDAIDAAIKTPSNRERGRRIAEITNYLEMQYNLARHNGLGESLKTDKRRPGGETNGLKGKAIDIR